MKTNQIIIGVIVLAVIGAGLYLFVLQDKRPKTVAKGEYNTFAQCLTAAGMKMYGSATCAVCHRQRTLFSTSFEFIKEIECDPRNEGAQTALCVKKNITHTPTWIKEDANGNELFRFEPGFQEFKALAEASGCPLVKDVPAETGS